MSWIRRETEKGTVQYICPRCHDYHEFREDFGERTFSENYIFCRRCGARNGTGNAPTLIQPNEPLTFEERREMGGKPVWLYDEKTFGILQFWDDNNVDAVFLDPSGCICVKSVIGKKIYRRPPGGEEET